MTGIMAALIGLATILTAQTLVWMISVRRREASVADTCWGLGFVAARVRRTARERRMVDLTGIEPVTS